MDVDNGRFFYNWEPPWKIAGWPIKLETEINYQGDPAIIVSGQPLGPPNDWPKAMGRHFALGWEDSDVTFRFHALRAKVLWRDIIVKKSKTLVEWKFRILESPQFFQAGTLPDPPKLPDHRNHVHVAYAPGGMIEPTPGGNPVPENLPPAAMSARGRGSADLVPGRLRGYREWTVKPADGLRPARLTSITANTVWPWTPINQAHCRRAEIGARFPRFNRPVEHDPDDVPNGPCTCGIYAKHKPDIYPSGKRIGGVIEAWGPTQLGDSAFRARYARLVALCIGSAISPERAEQAQLAALQYGVPLFMSREEMVDAYPPVDVTDLLAPETPPELQPVFCDKCRREMGLPTPMVDADTGRRIATRWYCLPCAWIKLTIP